MFPDRAELTRDLQRLARGLSRGMDELLYEAEEGLGRLASARVLRNPSLLLERRHERLVAWQGRLARAATTRAEAERARILRLGALLERRSPGRRLAERESRARELGLRARHAVRRRIEGDAARLAGIAGKLDALSPLKILGRGYSITTSLEGGQAIKRADELAPGARVVTRLDVGSLVSTVDDVRPPEEPSSE